MRTILIAALTAAFAAPATAATAAPSQAQQIKRLKAQLRRTTAKLSIVTRERDAARADLATVTADRDAARADLASRTVERDRLQADNDALRAGLPDAIRAVPLDKFWPLVFTPARQAWPCDTYYKSGSYWSVEFTSTPAAYC